MQVLFPDWLTTNTGDLDAIFLGVTSLKLTILVKNPAFSNDGSPGAGTTSHITSVSSLATLLANPAWQDVNQPAGKYTAQNWASPSAATVGISFTDAAPGQVRSVRVTGSEIHYWPVSKPCIATGFILSLVGGPNDGKIAMIWRYDTPIFCTGENNVISTKIKTTDQFFSYIEVAASGSSSAGWTMNPGSISVVVPTVDWETARSAHVWVDPQRINYVINPSFRTGPSTYPLGWRTTATTSQQITGGINRIDLANGAAGDTQPVGTEGSPKCLHLQGTSPIVLESNFFPTNATTENWRVSAECSGNGKFRVGIVFYQPSMAESEAIYLASPWQTFHSGSNNQNDFRRVFASLPAPDTTKEGCVRIEFQGTECWIDEVLAAPEDGPGTYFDAMTPTAQPGDFTWYGGNYGLFGNQSYSLFYNNRTNLDTLMFGFLAQNHSPGGPPVFIRGEAYNWVPEGVNVVPHWDDVFSTRTHTWLEDVIIPPKDFTNKNVVTTLTP